MELQVWFFNQELYFIYQFLFSLPFSVPGIVTMTDEEAQEHFDNFFEDVFAECEDKVLEFKIFSLVVYNVL